MYRPHVSKAMNILQHSPTTIENNLVKNFEYRRRCVEYINVQIAVGVAKFTPSELPRKFNIQGKGIISPAPTKSHHKKKLKFGGYKVVNKTLLWYWLMRFRAVLD